jgi:hypothetical protein
VSGTEEFLSLSTWQIFFLKGSICRIRNDCECVIRFSLQASKSASGFFEEEVGDETLQVQEKPAGGQGMNN